MDDTSTKRPETHEPYRVGPSNWAGHYSGGARKPFPKTSGRPTGYQFETPLLGKLKSWVDDLVVGAVYTPTSLLLVGRPGNGKTDAIESCIGFFDQQLSADGGVVRAFARQLNEASGLPPRKAFVDRKTLGIALPGHLQISIEVVQDATEADPAELPHADSSVAQRIKTLERYECLDKTFGVDGQFIRATPFFQRMQKNRGEE